MDAPEIVRELEKLRAQGRLLFEDNTYGGTDGGCVYLGAVALKRDLIVIGALDCDCHSDNPVDWEMLPDGACPMCGCQ